MDAVKQGKLSEDLVRERVKPLFYTRMRLGEFDPPEMNPYMFLNMSLVQSPAHQHLAVKAAMQTFVLLKNQDNLLPIRKQFNKIAVRVKFIFFKDYKTDPLPLKYAFLNFLRIHITFRKDELPNMSLTYQVSHVFIA